MSGYSQILIAVDQTADAEKVIMRGQQLGEVFSANCTLIHVVEPMIFDNNYEMMPVVEVDVQAQVVKRAEDNIQAMLTKLGLSAPVRVEIGSVKSIILDLSAELKIDLIVIGTHGRHGLSVLLGSTANSVLHGTRCDVLAVRV